MTKRNMPFSGHGSGLPLALSDLRLGDDGEPRVLDLELAERLGFRRAHDTLGGPDRGWGSQIETALADVADWPRWDAFDFTGRSRDPGLRTYPDATAAEVGINRMRERMLQNVAPGSHALFDRFCDLQLLYARAATGDFTGRFEDVLQTGAAISTFQSHIMGRARTDTLRRTADLSGKSMDNPQLPSVNA